MTTQPLLLGYARDAACGVQGGRTLHAAAFVAAAVALAARLPPGDCALLLCQDRLAFALGFAALQIRGATALLPPSHAAHAIGSIVEARKPSFALVDLAGEADVVPGIVVDPWLPTGNDHAMPEIPEAQVAAIVHTSGTTGAPQPHPKTWRSLVRGAAGLRERIGFAAGDALVGAVPPQHMWGLEATVMLPMQSGGIVHAAVPLLPLDIAAALEEVEPPRWLVLTPLHIRSSVQASVRWPRLAGVLSATSPLDRDLAVRFERAANAPAIEIYGSTETGVIATRRPAREDRFTPLAGLSVTSTPQGLGLRGAQLDSAVALGDRVDLHADGSFTLAGRDADLVKVGGKRASLAMLNGALRAVPGVVDGEFVVVDAAGLSSRLAALVVAPDLESDAILAALRERIDAVFLPRPLHRVESLPRNALGKLPAEALRRRIDELTALRALRPAPEADATRQREFLVPASHPALPGHFPAQPIVPAAWLMTMVATACRDAFGGARVVSGVVHARFRAPLAPATLVRVALSESAPGRVAFTCTAGAVRVADGLLALSGPVA